MNSLDSDLLGVFGADLSLEMLAALIQKGVFSKEESAALIMKVSKKNALLDKETATNANKKIAEFAKDIASTFSSQKN